jgi:hypothetical protein
LSYCSAQEWRACEFGKKEEISEETLRGSTPWPKGSRRRVHLNWKVVERREGRVEVVLRQLAHKKEKRGKRWLY